MPRNRRVYVLTGWNYKNDITLILPLADPKNVIIVLWFLILEDELVIFLNYCKISNKIILFLVLRLTFLNLGNHFLI